MRITGIRAIAALLLGIFAAGEAAAQDSLLTRMLQSQQRWLQFVIVDGRVNFNWTRQISYASNSNGMLNGEQVSESFQVVNQNGRLQLNYDRSSKSEQLKFVVSGNGDTLLITREPKGESSIVPFKFNQTPGEKIKLSLGTGEKKQTFAADELWQLLLEHPKQCEEHLYPLLEMLRSDWKLAESAAKIQSNLLQGAGDDVLKRRDRWSALVQQLGDDNFAKRETADRTLRTEGAAVVGYLRRLNFTGLDAEQQFRIRRIIESFNNADTDDSPEDVADRLGGDPAVWLALLGNADENTRKTAAKQLAILLGEEIGVDPLADPNTQTEQRERLEGENRIAIVFISPNTIRAGRPTHFS